MRYFPFSSIFRLDSGKFKSGALSLNIMNQIEMNQAEGYMLGFLVNLSPSLPLVFVTNSCAKHGVVWNSFDISFESFHEGVDSIIWKNF